MSNYTSRTRGRTGFSLIELLVVVSIIALLISILLPSLSSARAQARTTVCASRISQETKAMFMYAEDYDERPPFIGTGFGMINGIDDYSEKDVDYSELGPTGTTGLFLAQHEQWLIPNLTKWWFNVTWDDAIADQVQNPPYPDLKKGTLFPYTRFENLYRCPEFERKQGKTQSLFNYTRSLLGRKLLLAIAGDRGPGLDEITSYRPGQIMRPSAVYAPGQMYMMLDEQWDYHVGGPSDNYNSQPSQISLPLWMAADTVHTLLGDMMGSYHGNKGKEIPLDEMLQAKKGSCGYYDGHVDTWAYPWPWWSFESDVSWTAGFEKIKANTDYTFKALNALLSQLFAQRGLETPESYLQAVFALMGI